MENKCWKEREMEHTFRKVAMCKWQMDDPEARVKSLLSDCTWLEGLSMDLSSRHLRTNEAKRTEEHLYFFTFILFPSHFLSFFLFFLYSSFFSYFSFLSSYFFFIFFFCSSELLQHNTYIAFVRDDVMTPPPCLNDARPRAQKRGEMTAKASINSIILRNI
jgi:hypothetical protein